MNMISEIRELSTDEPTTGELTEAELNRVTGSDGASQHMKSNCMRAMSDTQDSIVSNLRA